MPGKRAVPWRWMLVLGGLAGLWASADPVRREASRPPFANAPTEASEGAEGAPRPSPSFDEVWHDGRAELCGYRWTGDRYGSPRAGRAVLITVTEPFSRSLRVKVEDPAKDPSDVFEALKINLVRRFQTGIYDYHTMISLFTDSSRFAPVKLAFSATEWCGQVYEETTFADSETRASISSYFENESAHVAIPTPADGIVEDDLFVLLRGLREPFLAQGERREAPFLASPFFRRLTHRPLAWSTASIERLAKTEIVKVPAGTFTAVIYRVRTEDGREGRFAIEDGPAHRILRWEWTPAPAVAPAASETRATTARVTAPAAGARDCGELTGSVRLAYWKLHDPGDEKFLRELGLAIPAP